MQRMGRVAEIWRYPVKSMRGERLEGAEVGPLGVDGDRRFGVLDLDRGSILSAKRAPGLFGCAACYGPAGDLRVELPDGTTRGRGPELDAALTALLRRRVAVVSAKDHPAARIQMAQADTTTEGESRELPAPPGTFFDASPIHFLTTSTLARYRALYPDGDFDPRRFRANFVVDTGGAGGFVEDEWIGRDVRIGEIELRVTKGCSRCVMTTLEQSDLARDRGILRTIARENDNSLGVRAFVSGPGAVTVGDDVRVATRQGSQANNAISGRSSTSSPD
jgi:uncharacterized protein YcbX